MNITTTATDLTRVHPWLDAKAQALGVPDSMRQAMEVALEEAVMNVAMHGFAPGIMGEITIALELKRDTAVLEVEDSGRPFDPSRARHGKPDASGQPGGRGLTLLHHYCRDIGYQRIGDRNRLTLRFPIPH